LNLFSAAITQRHTSTVKLRHLFGNIFSYTHVCLCLRF